MPGRPDRRRHDNPRLAQRTRAGGGCLRGDPRHHSLGVEYRRGIAVHATRGVLVMIQTWGRIIALVFCLTSSVLAAEPRMIEPKYKVRWVRDVRVPARDGITLSADLLHPDVDGRFPAIIEYIPYRKDDRTRSGYDVHRYLAERGFVG